MPSILLWRPRESPTAAGRAHPDNPPMTAEEFGPLRRRRVNLCPMNAVFVVLAPLAIAIFALVMERFEAKVVGTTGETATPVAEASSTPPAAEKSTEED